MTMLERQLSQVSALASPEVAVSDDAVVVHLGVRDATIVDYYRSMEEGRRPMAARNAFTIGSRALASAGGSATMAALEERLAASVETTGARLAELPQDVGNAMESLCGRYFGERGEFAQHLGEKLDAVGKQFGVDGAIVIAIRDAVAADARKRVTEALDPIVRSLNVNDADGPLGLMQRTLHEMKAGQAALHELVQSTVRVREERAIAVHKGYDLEAFAAEVLGGLAGRLGDCFEDCSRVAGIAGCKDGDFLSQLDSQLVRGESAIVIETKNRSTESVSSLCRTLDSARKNRNADVAIGVLTAPDLPLQPIAFYGPDKVLVHLPGFGSNEADLDQQARLVELGYYAARMQAVALAGGQPRDAIDVGLVSQHLEQLANASKKFSNLRAKFTGIEKSVEAARECADDIRAAFDAAAGELQDALVRQTTTLKA